VYESDLARRGPGAHLDAVYEGGSSGRLLGIAAMIRRGTVALAAALALLAPAGALAQSVGDEQYRDPFAGEDQQQGGGDQGGDSTPAPAAPAPSPAPAAPAPTPAVDPTTGEPIATTADTLPRTGAAAVGVAVAGVLLLAAGASLRRGTRK